MDSRFDPDQLQNRLHRWREHNFPEPYADAVVNQVLGVCEEAGELAKAVLKRRQGIRRSEEDHEVAEQDAVGDIMIFLAGFCSYRNWDMISIYEDVADAVMQRDWVKYPKDGRTA